jgi:hypothetical protein
MFRYRECYLSRQESTEWEDGMKKKRIGRPPGRKAPHRPVVSARVPEALYQQLKEAAAAGGRTLGEELVWRADRAGEWTAAFGELEAWQAKNRDQIAEFLRGNVENAMLANNWKRVPGARYGRPNWISPDNHSMSPWEHVEVEAAATISSERRSGELDAMGTFEAAAAKLAAEFNSDLNKFMHRIRALRANTQAAEVQQEMLRTETEKEKRPWRARRSAKTIADASCRSSK